MSKIDKPSSSSNKIGGIFSYYCMPIRVSQQMQKITLPESLTQFPISMLLSFFISNVIKLAIPFTLEYLYLNLNPNNIAEPMLIFICVIILNYYIQLKGEDIMNKHILKVKEIMCRRVIRSALRAPYQNFINNDTNSAAKRSSWSKITANVSIFVHNYYGSYITIIFQTLKALVIVGYLFHKIGWITLLGMFISGVVVQFTGFLSSKIENAKFNQLKAMQNKTKILTEYFSRIIDYQMSWLDGFIGDRIDVIQNQYQRNLRRTKMLDAWCVGLWQFTQICISSIVLCVFYFYYASTGDKNQQNKVFIKELQPATIIYLFQMLTFPMNAISWNIAGLNNAERALRELNQSQRNVQTQKKRIKAIQKYDYGYEISSTIRSVKLGKIYVVSSQDVDVFRKLALGFANINKQSEKRQVSYAEQNGFLLPTLLQNLYMQPKQYMRMQQIQSNIDKIVKVFRLCKFQEFPLQNSNISTYSGGQKMRLSLIRAFLNGKYIVIDSDLTSLDKNTRNAVFNNFKQYVVDNPDVCILIKGKKGDQQLQKIAYEWIQIQSKFSRVKFKPNIKNSRNANKSIKKGLFTQKSPLKQRFKSRDKFKQIQKQISKQSQQALKQKQQQMKKQKQNQNKQIQFLHEKLLYYISQQQGYQKLESSPTSPQAQTQMRVSQAITSRIPTKLVPKLKLTLKTLNFYFSHRFYHILFVLSLAGMYCVGNYYNYFVNVNKPEDPYEYGYAILKITSIYVIFIAFRSVTFAIANLKQSKRISKLTNMFTIFNHISFYDRLNLIDHQPEPEQQQNKQSLKGSSQLNEKNLATQKLVALCTSDLKIINDNFPFSTNILWNNIATVIGSLIMVFIQVPEMIIFTILFVLLIKNLQETYRTNNEILLCNSKDQEVKLMKAVNNIEQGALYIQVYGKRQKFMNIFNQQLKNNIQYSNQQSRLSIWVKTNFRFNMILFLVTSVGLFWVNYIIFGNKQTQSSAQGITNNSKQSAKMSIMLRYILLLADYIFYLTMSLSECRGQALSIQRVRRHAQNSRTINDSFKRIQYSNHKKQNLIKSLKQNEKTESKQFINLKNFCYHYNKYRKEQPPVLNNINLQVKYGDKVMLKGQTGAGKTTLFKVLMGLYPEVYFSDKINYLLSFSSQHPLKMGQCSVLQKIDPYKILQLVPQNVRATILQKSRKMIEKQEQNNKKRKSLSYQQQIVINNLRAYLYGFKGLALYDQPQIIPNQKENSTYIVVTHHRNFINKNIYILQKGKLIQFMEQSP